MQQERSHEQRIPFPSETIPFTRFTNAFLNPLAGYDAHSMSSWRNPEGAITLIAVIQVQAYCHQVFKHAQWGLREIHTILQTGKSISVAYHSLGKRKHQILMPCDFPIRFSVFIKGDCLNGYCMFIQQTVLSQPTSCLHRDGFDHWEIKKTTLPCFRGLEKNLHQLIPVIGFEEPWSHCETAIIPGGVHLF
jgi:hypothetical protein